jgi:hypothetical protein
MHFCAFLRSRETWCLNELCFVKSMKKVFLILMLFVATTAWAHVGSPDVFYEGNAGPYKLFVTVRMPDVIPGVAQVEIRSQSPDVSGLRILPLRLTGAGSQYSPIADTMQPSARDRQFFTGRIWLMEFNTLQLRVEANGSKGSGTLAVPIMAEAQRTLTMNRPLGTLLLMLLAFLAVSSIWILRAALGEAKLAPGTALESRNAGRLRWTTTIAALVVIAIVFLGNFWWNANATAYSLRVMKPPVFSADWSGTHLALHAPDGRSPILRPFRSGAEIGQTLPWSQILSQLRPDHGHLMHLFLVRTPGLNYFCHIHPDRDPNSFFSHDLPNLPAGHYQMFADVVTESGLAVTMIGQTDLPKISDATLQGDDSIAAAPPQEESIGMQSAAPLTDGRMVWERGNAPIHARTALELRFHVEDSKGAPVTNLEPYMGMAGHLVVLRSDGSVFAHVHPAGSVAMASLELAQQSLSSSSQMSSSASATSNSAMPDMPGMNMQPTTFGPEVSFPYGFPQSGNYRLFVQVKHNGQVQTGVFDVAVEP